MENSTLRDIILNCLQHEETDDLIHQVFAKRIDGKFEATSEAVILGMTEEEAELKIIDFVQSKCPGFDYFLELYILQDFFRDIKKLKEYKSDGEKVKEQSITLNLTLKAN